MNKLIGFVIGISFLSILSYASFKKLNSSSFQTLLIYDFNNGTRSFKLEELEDKLDYYFPNITATALPMKYLVARYYLGIDSTEVAKKLIHESIKDNPYIFAPEVLLAQIYLRENKIDSAYFYSKKAFYGLSDNNRHRDTYFKVLRELNDSIRLDSAFNKIKNKKNASHWYDYILVRNDINKKLDTALLSMINEVSLRFPNEDTMKINSIYRFIKLGSDRYTTALINSEKANIEFKKGNYIDAINYFEAAISLDNQQYIFFENAAIAYDNIGNYKKAEEYFNKVIYEFKVNDGKSEFYKGLMLIKNKKNTEGCMYLESSAQKNYIGFTSGIKAINVYMQLCKK